jgi:hypothetical protein
MGCKYKFVSVEMCNSIDNIIMKLGRMRLNFAKTGIQYNSICPKYTRIPAVWSEALTLWFEFFYMTWHDTFFLLLYFPFRI